jgi:hypothetical protein
MFWLYHWPSDHLRHGPHTLKVFTLFNKNFLLIFQYCARIHSANYICRPVCNPSNITLLSVYRTWSDNSHPIAGLIVRENSDLESFFAAQMAEAGRHIAKARKIR